MATKYKLRSKLMSHQQEYLRRLGKRPASPSDEDVMAVLGEMGTGKSLMVLAEWQDAVGRGELRDIMVIALAGSYRNWFVDRSSSPDDWSELRKHLDPKLYQELVVGAWVSGGNAQSRRALERCLAETRRPRALFMNVEALSSVARAEEVAVEFLSRGSAMLVIDESTKIKGGRAERTKTVVRKLGPLARARRIMTGWITPRSPLDLYWQFYFLDWRILGFESPLGFRNRYAVVEKQCFLPNDVIRAKLRSSMGLSSGGDSTLSDARLVGKLRATREHVGGSTSKLDTLSRRDVLRKLAEEAAVMRRDSMLELIPKLGGYVQVVDKIKEFRNLKELDGKMSPYSFRVLKKDCMDLPPKVYEPRDVELTAEQRRLYEEIRRCATAELDEESHVTTTSVITQMMRLHQIVCGHVVDESGELRDVDSNRVGAVLDVVEEHQGKVIIWATYQHEIRKIAAALKKEYGPKSAALFYGGNKSRRGEEERRFLSDAECRFMVSTQSAGGLGNNWVVADLVVYAANSYDLELRVQSEDRAHRRGQTRSVTYVDLIARGTVEEKIIQSLRSKIDLTTAITGENYREWLI